MSNSIAHTQSISSTSTVKKHRAHTQNVSHIANPLKLYQRHSRRARADVSRCARCDAMLERSARKHTHSLTYAMRYVHRRLRTTTHYSYIWYTHRLIELHRHCVNGSVRLRLRFVWVNVFVYDDYIKNYIIAFQHLCLGFGQSVCVLFACNIPQQTISELSSHAN